MKVNATYQPEGKWVGLTHWCDNNTPSLTSASFAPLSGNSTLLTGLAYTNAPNDFRLRQIANYGSNSVLISYFGYQFDALGEISGITHQTNAGPALAWDYDYDLGGQLSSALLRTATNNPSTGWPDMLKSFAYLYDKAGNRIEKRGQDEVWFVFHTYWGLGTGV